MAYEIVSVVKYIVPSITSGPVCSGVSSGRLYAQTSDKRDALARSICVSGENRSPPIVRPYAGQSPPDPCSIGASVVVRLHAAMRHAERTSAETEFGLIIADVSILATMRMRSAPR